MSDENTRRMVHTRSVICRAYRLENGLLEIEAELSDEKGQQVGVGRGDPIQQVSVTGREDRRCPAVGQGLEESLEFRCHRPSAGQPVRDTPGAMCRRPGARHGSD